jgi:beta-carotene 15,15'-dioxygenase
MVTVSGAIVRAAGPVVALLTVGLTLVTSSGNGAGTIPSWQIALALVALAAGIPHGAVDHLIIGRPTSLAGWSRYVSLYVAIAGAATWFILVSPRIGFLLVVVMTIAHFGSGDAAYSASLSGAARLNRLTTGLRIVAGGSIPIVLPLTHPDSTRTLTAINPELVGWLTSSALDALRWGTVVVAIVTAVMLFIATDRRGAGELLVLLSLCLVAQPLVAFAVYFAAWHALRHTARLAGLKDDDGKPLDPGGRALAKTAVAGTPALAIVVAAAVVLWPMASENADLSGLLWVSLAIVWGLTVPHMALVSQMDRRAFTPAREGSKPALS